MSPTFDIEPSEVTQNGEIPAPRLPDNLNSVCALPLRQPLPQSEGQRSVLRGFGSSVVLRGHVEWGAIHREQDQLDYHLGYAIRRALHSETKQHIKDIKCTLCLSGFHSTLLLRFSSHDGNLSWMQEEPALLSWPSQMPRFLRTLNREESTIAVQCLEMPASAQSGRN